MFRRLRIKQTAGPNAGVRSARLKGAHHAKDCSLQLSC